MLINKRATQTTVLLVGAIALGMGAYARYRPLENDDRISSHASDMDNPEYVKEKARMQDEAAARSKAEYDEQNAPTLRSTYDPSRERLAEGTSTSTNTSTNRSSADQVDDDL